LENSKWLAHAPSYSRTYLEGDKVVAAARRDLGMRLSRAAGMIKRVMLG
jgi:hypothetical protein